MGHPHERDGRPAEVPGQRTERAALEHARAGGHLPHVQRPGQALAARVRLGSGIAGCKRRVDTVSRVLLADPGVAGRCRPGSLCSGEAEGCPRAGATAAERAGGEAEPLATAGDQACITHRACGDRLLLP